MKAYLVDSLIGVVALSDDGEVLAYSLAPRSLDELVDFIEALESGVETLQHKEVIGKLKELGVSEVVVEVETLAKAANAIGLRAFVEAGNRVAVAFRSQLPNYAVSLGFASNPEEYWGIVHEATLEATRRKLRKEAGKRDQLAVQAIRAIDDIDKTINLYIARLREWYSLHFPELDEVVKEHADYANIVAKLGYRSNIGFEPLVKIGFSKSKAEKIAEVAEKSIGADLSDFDVEKVQTLANIIMELYKLRSELTDYISAVMKEVAPNITALVGPLLGARLLSLAGGLDELAKLPASTIQVLGAEKALFRALRTGGKPPKHGVIFQFPEIHKAPRWQRGKMARALAAKLAIAAKIDRFTGRDVGEKLKKELEERIEEVKKLYPKPPPRKEAALRETRESRSRKQPKKRGSRGEGV
ncbi:MAG: C/D box methylation guide ribonucleoprotein complex aNOP56 subunit [Sulfolobales archaeon]|nr:C/D box methylation guide ribonucleoprotein complex aNOP56 subunit [Sulfolobales archaeon]